MFRCCSLEASRPRPLPESPEVCSVHLSLFFCLAYKVIITIFLNSIIYVLVCCNVLLSFWLTWLCTTGSSCFQLIRTDAKEIFFNGWVIFHGVYVPRLPYPFVCWWASGLLPCPGCGKECCEEHWGACVSFRSAFLSGCAQKWYCWVIMAVLFPGFKKFSTLFSIVAVLVCIPTHSVRGFPFPHTLSSIYCL